MYCYICKKDVYGSVCKECGLVLEDHPIDYTLPQKIRSKFNKDKKVFVENFSHLLKPNIQYTNINDKKYYKKNTKEYHYTKAYIEISKFCSMFKLGGMIKYEALNIYNNIYDKDKNFFIKYNLMPSYLAFIRLACKIHDFHINLKSIHNLCGIKKFNRSYTETIKLLHINVPNPENPRYIGYVGKTLNLDYKKIVLIYKYYKRMKKDFINGKQEGYILALYLLTNKNLTIKDLSVTFNISEPTISRRKKEVLKLVK